MVAHHRRWLPILTNFAIGTVVAFFGGALVYVPLELLLLPFLRVPKGAIWWSDYILGTILFVGSIAFGVMMAMGEVANQLEEFRHKNNLCVKCGYSLRGLSGPIKQCPECGTINKR